LSGRKRPKIHHCSELPDMGGMPKRAADGAKQIE
jgi:hypothetical protein